MKKALVATFMVLITGTASFFYLSTANQSGNFSDKLTIKNTLSSKDFNNSPSANLT